MYQPFLGSDDDDGDCGGCSGCGGYDGDCGGGSGDGKSAICVDHISSVVLAMMQHPFLGGGDAGV